MILYIQQKFAKPGEHFRRIINMSKVRGVYSLSSYSKKHDGYIVRDDTITLFYDEPHSNEYVLEPGAGKETFTLTTTATFDDPREEYTARQKLDVQADTDLYMTLDGLALAMSRPGVIQPVIKGDTLYDCCQKIVEFYGEVDEL